MTATKRKLIYALVVLLFLFVFALIGWLAHVLLAFRAVPPSTRPAPVSPVKHQQPGAGPFSETVIDIDSPPDLPPGKPEQEDEMPVFSDTIGAAGHIPCLCEGYGPQISAREAFPNPLTHETVVSATRAVVTLTIQPEAPRGDQ